MFYTQPLCFGGAKMHEIGEVGQRHWDANEHLILRLEGDQEFVLGKEDTARKEGRLNWGEFSCQNSGLNFISKVIKKM